MLRQCLLQKGFRLIDSLLAYLETGLPIPRCNIRKRHASTTTAKLKPVRRDKPGNHQRHNNLSQFTKINNSFLELYIYSLDQHGGHIDHQTNTAI